MFLSLLLSSHVCTVSVLGSDLASSSSSSDSIRREPPLRCAGRPVRLSRDRWTPEADAAVRTRPVSWTSTGAIMSTIVPIARPLCQRQQARFQPASEHEFVQLTSECRVPQDRRPMQAHRSWSVHTHRHTPTALPFPSSLLSLMSRMSGPHSDLFTPRRSPTGYAEKHISSMRSLCCAPETTIQ
jgi:hypothetical protein